MAMSVLLRRMNVDATVHGMRSSAPHRPGSRLRGGLALDQQHPADSLTRARAGNLGRRDRESDADQAPGPVVTRNAEHPDSPDDRNTAVVANAARLLSDAKLLIDHGRHASAFALAVLVEEIGKLLLKLWGVPEGTGYDHLSKQRAVASLLIGLFLAKEFGSEIEAGSNAELDEGLVERAAKAMYESEHGRFDSFVALTAVDKAKQLALYHDEWWVAAGLDQNFERKDVEWLFAKCRSALLAIAEPKAMQAGKAMWQTQTVGRKRQRPHG